MLTLAVGLVHAQTQARMLEGNVVNSNTNSPVADVTIFIEGTNIYTTSDQEGVFEINLSLDGNFRLIASCIGYKTLERHI